MPQCLENLSRGVAHIPGEVAEIAGRIPAWGKKEISIQILNSLITGYEAQTHIVSIEGIDNLASAYEARKKAERPVPMIFAINHTSQAELFVIFKLMHEVVDRDASQIGLVISRKYMDPKEFPTYSMVVNLARKLGGVTLIPVEQAYRNRTKDDFEPVYPDIIPRKKYKKSNAGKKDQSDSITSKEQAFLTTEMLEELFLAGKCLLIAPSGHREDYMTTAELGFGMIVGQLMQLIEKGQIDEALIVPIAIERLGKKGCGVIDPRKYFRLHILPYLTPGILIAKGHNLGEVHKIRLNPSLTAHALMLEIARKLPEAQRGVYNETDQNVFSAVLRNRIVLGVSKRGYVEPVWRKK